MSFSLSNARSQLRVLPYTLGEVAWISSLVDRSILVIAFGAGGFLRLWELNSLGFNTDEAVYAGQAAAIVGDSTLQPFFPLFRAHPMLFQFIVSLGFIFGVNDLTGRLFSVAIGLATVYLVYRLGALLYGRRAGVLAALFLAVMPYHVVVTRQLLLDGPMTFCATLSLYLTARYAMEQKRLWLAAVGASFGLVFLSKENGIVLLGSLYAFLALSPEIRVRFKDLLLSVGCMAAVIAVFPLSLSLAGAAGTKTAQSYLVWQLFRRPNHEWTFYPTAVTPAIGPLLLLLAFGGLWLLRRDNSWREKLLVSWIAVQVVFFQLWPTKGFQYLLPIAPAVALLAARVLALWAPQAIVTIRNNLSITWVRAPAICLVALTLAVPSWSQIQTVISSQFLAGSGGVPGGREAGLWISANTPEGATLLTLGPSMSNILQFYGHRKAYALSVSPNPLHRNPSYEPIRNPDLQIRTGEVQYLVWDSFSSSRSQFFADSLMKYIKRYNGRVVYTKTVSVSKANGSTTDAPIIVIYQVRP